MNALLQFPIDLFPILELHIPFRSNKKLANLLILILKYCEKAGRVIA